MSAHAVWLRRITADDVDRVYGWVSGTWYTKDFAGSAVPTPESHRAYFSRVLEGDEFFFAVEYKGVHVGNAGVKNIEGDAGEIWYYVGEESMRGKGIASAIVAELVAKAHRELGLNRFVARVLESNAASRRVLEKNGFEQAVEGFGEHGGERMLKYVKEMEADRLNREGSGE